MLFDTMMFLEGKFMLPVDIRLWVSEVLFAALRSDWLLPFNLVETYFVDWLPLCINC